MNRLSNYFENVKLAKMHMITAAKYDRDGDGRSVYNVLKAMEYMLTAMNNVASIGFNKKPKAARRPKYDTLKTIEAKARRADAVFAAARKVFPDSIAGQEVKP